MYGKQAVKSKAVDLPLRRARRLQGEAGYMRRTINEPGRK
jgi:hypothetical protein